MPEHAAHTSSPASPARFSLTHELVYDLWHPLIPSISPSSTTTINNTNTSNNTINNIININTTTNFNSHNPKQQQQLYLQQQQQQQQQLSTTAEPSPTTQPSTTPLQVLGFTPSELEAINAIALNRSFLPLDEHTRVYNTFFKGNKTANGGVYPPTMREAVESAEAVHRAVVDRAAAFTREVLLWFCASRTYPHWCWTGRHAYTIAPSNARAQVVAQQRLQVWTNILPKYHPQIYERVAVDKLCEGT
jgi:hypothetical protein